LVKLVDFLRKSAILASFIERNRPIPTTGSSAFSPVFTGFFTGFTPLVRVLESGPHNLELALLPAGMTLSDSDTLLSARLRKQHPDLPLLLAYWPESEAFPTAKDRARPLEMPFSVQSLTTCVRDLLPDRLAGASVPVPAGA